MTAAEITAALSGLNREELLAIVIAAAAQMANNGKGEPAPAELSDADDQQLTLAEAAVRIRRSLKWLYRHRKSLPFIRQLAPRSYVASKQKLDSWLAKRPS